MTGKKPVHFTDECTEKTTREEHGGVYVGVWAAHTPTYTGFPLAVDLFLEDSLISEDPTSAMVSVDQGQPELDAEDLPSLTEMPYRGLNNGVG